jgi:hypothetical protein
MQYTLYCMPLAKPEGMRFCQGLAALRRFRASRVILVRKVNTFCLILALNFEGEILRRQAGCVDWFAKYLCQQRSRLREVFQLHTRMSAV